MRNIRLYLVKGVQHALGVTELGPVVIWVIVFLICFSLFADFITQLINLVPSPWLVFGIKAVPFAALAIFIALKARKADHARLGVQTSRPPSTVSFLSIFLSTPGLHQGRTGALWGEADIASMPHDTLRAELDKTNWCFPIRAIEYHISRLQTLYVFPSADSQRDGRTMEGSILAVPLFRAVVSHLFPKLKIVVVRGESGIDFEDVGALYRAILDEFLATLPPGTKPYDVTIDITSGTKPATIAGVFASLEPDLRVQYVSTITKEVLAYDLTFEEMR